MDSFRKEIPAHEGGQETALKECRKVFFEGHGWVETPIYDREKLGAGFCGAGPLVVEEVTTATVVCPGQSLSVDRFGNDYLIVEPTVGGAGAIRSYLSMNDNQSFTASFGRNKWPAWGSAGGKDGSYNYFVFYDKDGTVSEPQGIVARRPMNCE